MLEQTLEALIVKELKALSIHAYKFVSPGRTGVPDRICFGPEGLMFMVEVKQATGKLSPAQYREKQRFEDRGFKVWVVSTKEEMMELVSHYEKK